MHWLPGKSPALLDFNMSSHEIAASANWIFNFMVVMITPVAFENIKYKTYIIFAVM